MIQIASYRRQVTVLLTGIIGFVAILALLALPTRAAGIAQGFESSDGGLQVGMIAALATDSTAEVPKVERASTSNKAKVVGIITTIDSSSLTFTSGGTKVYVTSSGESTVLVSDVNGAIKKGDVISVSPLKGIGMRSNADEVAVVGVALEDFPSTNTTTREVNTNEGSKKTVVTANLRVSLDTKTVSTEQAAKATPFLLLFGESITGKSVSQNQVLISLVIFFILLIVEGSIIYGAISSTVTSLGRNPLARAAVYRQLLQVTWLSLVILVFGLGAIYVVLYI